MEWIASMYGPQFLMLYGSVIVVALGACWWVIRNVDNSHVLPPMLVPSSPDPYEIAYLRGGVNEVTRVILISLIERGYLQVRARTAGVKKSEDDMLEWHASRPDSRHLPAVERAIFEAFRDRVAVSQIYRDKQLLRQIESACSRYEHSFDVQRLLLTPDERRAKLRWVAGAAMMILSLGGFKLLAALAKGRHNVGFLILMALLSMVALFLIGRNPRLTRRGRDYLRRLSLAFEQLKPRLKNSYAPGGDALLLGVAVFGVGALAGTGFDRYHDIFRRGQGPGGGCGGGASCGGSSCGGGGCGGGGCGGCGG